ncbi:MAG: N-acetylglucosamine-6-phosphate deacetylase [Trueperaceae bacterium]|nr:N-acetylglucosamine-6-phosphate deacetylase [Trueperaceae bacterium]
MITLEGWIAQPDGMRRGRVDLGDDGTIMAVRADGPAVAVPGDDAARILPGFVDAHVHGGGGGDTMDGPAGVRALARHHLRHGTTTLLPTTITNPWTEVMRALRGVAEVRAHPDDAADPLPDLPGAHLEGPFINPGRLGAQPPNAVPAAPERVAEVLATEVVRVVTLAPEVDGAIHAARTFAAAGVRISVGHTRANAGQVADLLRAVRGVGGTAGFTHLYNAMGGLEGRAPDVVGACFADPGAWAEVILDGHHVHPTSFLAARAAKGPRLFLVTDAIRACGMPEGTTELGGQQVRVLEGAARLQDGTLAGSVLTLDAAVRNATAAGVPLAEAAAMAATGPAGYLGLADRGVLRQGARADVVEMDPDLYVTRVFTAGRPVPAAGHGLGGAAGRAGG